MIAFAFITAEGIPTGGGIRRELPDGAIPLTPPFTTNDLARLRYRDGAWELRNDMPQPAPPSAEELAARAAGHLAAARRQAVAQVNARAGAIRARIYTDIPGQDALYLEKRAEAQAYVAETRRGAEPASLRDYPLLANEVGITAPDPWALAQVWLNRSDQFKRLGAATERLRMQALTAIATAPDEKTIDAIMTNLNEALSGLST